MRKAIKIGAALAISAVAGLTVATNVSAWGDSDGGRQTYTIKEIESGVLKNKVVFNSISNGSIGNEKYFVSAREDNGDKSASNLFNTGDLTIEEGKEYVVRLYVHNNNPQGTKVVAKDTTVKFSIPTESKNSLDIYGYLTASNATPSEYWDHVTMKSADGRAFYLDYIEGSATYWNNKVAEGGLSVSDKVITTSGIKIGYDKLDGNIPGCFDYDGYVTIKVKPVFTDDNYVVDKRVRLEGTKDWAESIEAKVGDRVEYMIKYQNTTENAVDYVMFRDVLPKNMKIVSDVVLFNTTNPNGLTMGGDVTAGINIGGYAVDAIAYVKFTAEVVDNTMVCGTNTLRNWGQITANNVARQDSADVVVKKVCQEDKPIDFCTEHPNDDSCKEPKKDCTTNPEMAECQKDDPKKDDPKKDDNPKTDNTTKETPKEMPSTGATEIVMGALGVGSTVTVAGYYIASRKTLR